MVKRDENYSSFWSKSKAHNDAEIAREENRHLDALKLIEEAFLDYQKEENYEGFVQALQSRCLTYKHLFLLTKDKTFGIMAKKDAEVSLEVAQEHNLSNTLGSCYFRLGEISTLFEDYEKAIKNYQKALENYHGTSCEKGDYRYHLGEALYKSGKKEEGREALLAGLKEIQKNRSEVNDFLANVWESGCYMKLAEVLREDEPEEAKKYLERAREIAESDPKLIIRKRQIEKLAGTFK